MGYASYLEDISEKLDQAHRELRDAADDGSIDVQALRQEAIRILDRSSEQLIALLELSKLVDLATDPDVELAEELKNALSETASARAAKISAENMIKDLSVRVAKLEAEASTLKAKNKEVRAERNKLQRDLDRVIEANPSAAYDAYDSPRKR